MPNTENNPMPTCRVVLVDDHQVVRQGTRDMLIQHPQIEVVGELGNGEDIIPFLTLKHPDVLLLDINLPGQNGLQLLETIRPLFPDLKIILFSAFSDLAYIRKAQLLNADGYLTKTVEQHELQNAVLDICSEHKAVYSKDVSDLLAQALPSPASSLTPREQQILSEVARGETNAAIAQKLCLSVKTVDSHVANLMKKLGVNRRTQLATFAMEQGFL